MKKIFGNLYVMIASLVLFVFTSVSLICVLAHPLFYAGEYYSKIEYEGPEGDTYVDEFWLNMNADNTIDARRVVKNTKTGEEEEMTQVVWYYMKGKDIFQIGDTEEMTEEEYKEAVKEIEDMTEDEYKAYKDEMGYVHTFKAFYLSNESSLREGPTAQYIHRIYINSSKIPTVVVLSVVETLVLAVAAVSVTFFILNKKAKKEEPAPAETPAEEPAETPAE